MTDLATPRIPGADLAAALYESHYLTAVDPDGGRGLWLRHTALKRPGRPARPTTWLTWFDRAADAPVALRVTAEEAVRAPGPAWSRSSLGTFGPVAAAGTIAGATWSLAWTGVEPEVPYLPARWLYDRRVPRAGGVALVPVALVSGTLALPDGRGVAIEGWPGMVGHNWGSEHAERWLWLHAGGLGGDGRGWLDLVIVRVRLGPLLTPWIAGGVVMLDGTRRPPAPGRRVRVAATGGRTRVLMTLAGGDRLELEIDAPPAATVTWDYASPRAGTRTVRHCTVADATVRAGGRPAHQVSGRFAVEIGGPVSR